MDILYIITTLTLSYKNTGKTFIQTNNSGVGAVLLVTGASGVTGWEISELIRTADGVESVGGTIATVLAFPVWLWGRVYLRVWSENISNLK